MNTSAKSRNSRTIVSDEDRVRAVVKAYETVEGQLEWAREVASPLSPPFRTFRRDVGEVADLVRDILQRGRQRVG